MNPPTIVVDELMKFDEAKHRRARCDAARKVTALRHSDVFQEILEALMPVDFREEAGIDGEGLGSLISRVALVKSSFVSITQL